MTESPRLKTVTKAFKPLYPLNAFPKKFALSLGREIVYLLATRTDERLEGSDWESIFAKCIGAEWTPSNVGLDDVSYGQTAWGTKTVKNNGPFVARHVRLVCGRNSLSFSYGIKDIGSLKEDEIGNKILEIWNGRVSDVRGKYKDVRTVVLLKGEHLSSVAVYEEETKLFVPELYSWQWNESGNLEGYEKKTGIHRFTWQPSGSQFTVVSDLPSKRLKLRIKKPPQVSHDDVLKSIEFDPSWIEIVE